MITYKELKDFCNQLSEDDLPKTVTMLDLKSRVEDKMAEITITYDQLREIYDLIGDVKTIKIIEGNGGNIDVLPDGLEDEKFTLAENGEEL